MSKKAIFQQLIADFTERPLDHVIDRHITLPTDVPKVISIIGPRRAGKTIYIQPLWKWLLTEFESDLN